MPKKPPPPKLVHYGSISNLEDAAQCLSFPYAAIPLVIMEDDDLRCQKQGCNLPAICGNYNMCASCNQNGSQGNLMQRIIQQHSRGGVFWGLSICEVWMGSRILQCRVAVGQCSVKRSATATTMAIFGSQRMSRTISTKPQ